MPRHAERLILLIYAITPLLLIIADAAYAIMIEFILPLRLISFFC